jgi:hypothetical protein
MLQIIPRSFGTSFERHLRRSSGSGLVILELADFARNHGVIPDKLRSSADPGSIIERWSPSMDPGESPG